MAQEPEVLRRLKHYGLSQQDIGRALFLCRSTISQWAKGTRTMSAAHEAELWEMLTLVEAQVAAGGKAREALTGWNPIYREHPTAQQAAYCFMSFGPTPPDFEITDGETTESGYRKMILAAARILTAFDTPEMLQRPWSAQELAYMRQQFNAGLVWVQQYQRLIADRSPIPQQEESYSGQ